MLKVFFTRRKRKARSTMISKGDKSRGRRGREVDQRKGELWKEAE